MPQNPTRDPTHHPDRAPARDLAHDVVGAGPTVVLAHGFTQTRRVWGGLDDRLAASHRVVRVDLPGHGGSADVRAGVAEGADLLVATGGPGAYLGYSMGARHALRAALDHPGTVTALVLISGTPGLAGEDERTERRAADGALADQLDPPDGSPGTAVADFVRRWLDGPLFSGLDPAAAGVAERTANTAAGLAASLRLAGTGAQTPMWDRLATLAMPVLVVTGERDEKFTALGAEVAAATGSRHTVVGGAGHAPHLERPDEVARVVLDFLAGT